MSKRICYSTQRAGFVPGVDYRNPVFFEAPMANDGDEVTVIGNHPKVVAAYQAAGFAVNVQAAGSNAATVAPPDVAAVFEGATTYSDDANSRAESTMVAPSTFSTGSEGEATAAGESAAVAGAGETEDQDAAETWEGWTKQNLRDLCDERQVAYAASWNRDKLIAALTEE